MTPRLLKRNRLTLVLIIIAIVVMISVFFYTNLIDRLDAIATNPNPLIRHLSPTWQSLKKIIDVPFLIRSAFTRTNLPLYEIELSKNDRMNLLDNLPDFPAQTKLYDDDKARVKASFQFGDYSTDNAKVRYRGYNYNHWTALQKSWQVSLPADEVLDGRQEYRFIIPSDRGWVWAYLWNHVANKLNLITHDVAPVELSVNKKSMGLYILMEGWEESLITKHRKNPYRIFSDNSLDPRSFSEKIVLDRFRPDNIFQWYERSEPDRDPKTFAELGYLLELTANAPDDFFEQHIGDILDIDIFLRWATVSIIAGDNHQNNVENLNFYFNPATGKFEIIPFDLNENTIGSTIPIDGNRLLNRIVRIKKYRENLEALLNGYVADEHNIAEDLVFYASMTEKINPALERDTAKLPTTYEVRNDIRTSLDIYKKNVATIKNMLKNGPLPFEFEHETYPLSGMPFQGNGYESFVAERESRNVFLAKHPEFVSGSGQYEIVILPGKHIFTKNTIIPRGLRVKILSGAELYFNPGISILSYSPVEAVGTALGPIIMRPSLPNTLWGVFGIIDTEGKSVFKYVNLKGGKDTTINGVYMSGMLSAHDSDIEFASGRIEEAHADDGIHVINATAVIRNSRFINNFSDSVDVDYVTDQSVIRDNNFEIAGSFAENANGDAMDISGSSLTIEHNMVDNCSDKGISIGEESYPTVKNNIITRCTIGIAVKDRSEAIITNTMLIKNKIGLALYRKKNMFVTGGKAHVEQSILWQNDKDITIDQHSSLSIEKSVVEQDFTWRNTSDVVVNNKQTINDPTVHGELAGDSISHKMPDLQKLLPPALYRALFPEE